ncbi:MAG: hypothetical protein GX249_12810, partial [Firmicutes bacterium]|nr:hypothetical protein [Bacillota bacterium]
MKRMLVVDFGSDQTQDIARKVRELGVYSEIAPASALDSELRAGRLWGIIPVGSVPSQTFEELAQVGVPFFRSGDLVDFVQSTCSERDWNMEAFL